MTSHFNLPDVDSHWRPWKNTGSATVPPFGLVKLSGDGSEVSGLYHFDGKMPTGEGGYLYLVNGPFEVAQGKTGVCSGRWPLFVALESDAAVAAGRMVGIRADEAKLRPDRHGFISTGIRQSARLLVFPDESIALVEVTADMEDGAAACKFDGTDETLTAHDPIGTMSVSAGEKHYVKWNHEDDQFDFVPMKGTGGMFFGTLAAVKIKAQTFVDVTRTNLISGNDPGSVVQVFDPDPSGIDGFEGETGAFCLCVKRESDGRWYFVWVKCPDGPVTAPTSSATGPSAHTNSSPGDIGAPPPDLEL